MNSDDIENTVRLPANVTDPALRQAAEQDENRGGWPSPRKAEQPDPPWPGESDANLRLLLHAAQARLDAGMPTRQVMTHLAVHAWFEGGVENYDRGQRDARADIEGA